MELNAAAKATGRIQWIALKFPVTEQVMVAVTMRLPSSSC